MQRCWRPANWLARAPSPRPPAAGQHVARLGCALWQSIERDPDCGRAGITAFKPARHNADPIQVTAARSRDAGLTLTPCTPEESPPLPFASTAALTSTTDISTTPAGYLPSPPLTSVMGPAFVTAFSGLSVRPALAAPVSTVSPAAAPMPTHVTPAVRLPVMIAVPSRPTPAKESSPDGATETLSILLPEKLSDEGVELLSKDYNVVKNYELDPQTLLTEIANHDAIIVRSGTKVTREVIMASPRLKVIGRAGVGVDNIDLEAATERGVLVVNAPTGNCVAAAEHTISLMCAMARRIGVADATIKNGAWDRSKFVGVSLVGKTLGVIGLGRIGREVAKRAKGLGMSIVASDPFTSEEAARSIGVSLLSTDDLLAVSDFVTLHLPLIDSTRNLLDASAFAKMKDGVRIINAARGGIVNEEALMAALESGKVGGAALDCFEFEPPHKHPDSISAKIVQHEAVLATPHLGASTKEAQLDVAVEIASAVSNALKGDLVPTMINGPVIAPDALKEMKPRALLAERLGKLAYNLSGGKGAGDVTVTYRVPEPSEDTRLLRAGVVKGMMEEASDVSITIVNADTIAKSHGLKITEISHPLENGPSAEEVVIDIKGTDTVAGRVVHGRPHVTRIGRFEVDLELEGTVVAYSQNDRPGQLGRVGTVFGEAGINISLMTLARDKEFETGSKALVLLGLDDSPTPEILAQVNELVGDDYLHPMTVNFS